MLKYQYPPSPHTIVTNPVSDLRNQRDFDRELSTPTPTSTTQEAPTPTIATPGGAAVHRTRSDASMTMKVETESASGSRSPSETKAHPSFSKHPPALFHSHTDPPISYSGTPYMSRGTRRPSRFDPMAREDEEMEDEGYGELGGRHPLRRVKEERKEGGGVVSLPGFKTLFGVADHPPTPASSTHPPPLFQTPSLPSLAPNSPSSSPSSAPRSSRWSSLGSSISGGVSEPHPGWWAPDFERGPTTLPLPPEQRAYSFPSHPWVLDEHESKRRRSDQPRSTYDSEEAARLRWQAQSRNASFPASGSISAASGIGLRGLLHPPQAASSAMSRGSISASGMNSPLSPIMGHERRPSAVPRSASVVGGQLARSFADLSAADRTSPRSEMPPPFAPPHERRLSMLPHLDEAKYPFLSPLPLDAKRDSIITSATSRPPSAGADPLKRASVTRPSSPEPRPVPRRSSLTEIIRAKSGDVDTLATLRSREAVAMDKPSLSEPSPVEWPRRESTDSAKTAPGISLNSDGEGLTPSLRGRKRAADANIIEGDEEMLAEPGMSGMEVLAAESARRVAEEERKTRSSEDREGSPSKLPGPKYSCAFCAKTFSRPSSLRIHTYSHTGERPFVCKEPSCRRRFSVQSNLKRHAKVHQLGAQGHQVGMPMHQLGGPPPPHGMHPHPGPPELAMRHGGPPSSMGPGFYPPPQHGQGFPPGHYHPYEHPGRYHPQPPHMLPAGAHPAQGRLPPTAEYPPHSRRGSREEWSEEDELDEDELDEDD